MNDDATRRPTALGPKTRRTNGPTSVPDTRQSDRTPINRAVCTACRASSFQIAGLVDINVVRLAIAQHDRKAALVWGSRIARA